ncbi:3951_t:CDS:10 [Paraglomus brasilianum]|uniref:3951_t:CDS:1 n=1 Tax=Paraglomus brasilianum TaxID=144538 RepID=A0A9N9FDR3_9GLOM|nr:3951_t:CDS:10 [Paraglomus brasilianum]
MTSSVIFVKALYDFNSSDSSSLSFRRDDIIQVLTRLESGWWDGLCNGERGWFPSNYVTAVEDDDDFLDDEDKSDWVAQQTPDGDVFYFNPRTGESAWELPGDDNESVTTTPSVRDASSPHGESPSNGPPNGHAQRSSESRSGSISSVRAPLPEHWIRQPTEDGNTYYYLNTMTKEVRWTYPGGGNATASSGSDPEDKVDGDINGHDLSIEEEAVNDDAAAVDEESIASSHGSRLRRPYYFNVITDETTWSLDNVDMQTGQLINASPITTENQNEPHEDRHVDDLNDARLPAKKVSSSSLIGSNTNEPLTWESLSSNVYLAIHHLDMAVKESQKYSYTICTNSVVESIRIMLYASGTVEKESPTIRTNRSLKIYHRCIMASLSKLVLSTKVASGVWPPPDAAQKMKNDADEVLAAVKSFVQAANHLVEIKRVDPKILECPVGGAWRGNNLPPTQNGRHYKGPGGEEFDGQPNSPTMFPGRSLTPDLLASLDHISRNVNKAINLLLSHLRKAVDALRTNAPTNTAFAPQMISQTRQVVTQVGQFLSLIEDINLEDLDESSAGSINEFKIAKQALYHNVAGLVIYTQSATDPLAPPNVMDQVYLTTTIVDKSVKDVIIASKFLIEEKDAQDQQRMQSNMRRGSNTVDATVKVNSGKDSPEQVGETSSQAPTNTVRAEVGTEHKTLALETVPEDEVADQQISDDNLYNQTEEFDAGPSSNGSQTAIGDMFADPTLSPAGAKSPRDEKLIRFFGHDPALATSQKREEKPDFLKYDYDQSEIVFNLEGHVKGGTLRALVERLTMHDLLDSNFIATFLLTYRSFTTTEEFFDLLVKRFMIQPSPNLTSEENELWQEKKQTPIRLRVFNIMKSWLEIYYIDEADSQCLERMREFASTVMYEHMAFAANSLIKVIDKRKEQPKDATFKGLVPSTAIQPPPPNLPRNMKKLRFVDLDPLELARQLTLIESKLYNKIRPVECLGKAWSREEGGEIAENIKAMIVNSNQITGWVAESILHQSEIKKRCNLIKHFVAVAEKCRILNNFNSLTAIISGLNSAPIHRLKRTWEMVNARTIQNLEALNKVMNSTKNFLDYRAQLHSVNPPCVPFLGVYLTDLTFIEDGNPNVLKKNRNLINFSKRMKTAEVIREIQQYQAVPYHLTPVQEIQIFIKSHLQDSRDVGDLYALSLSMEPREREDEKIARLLQESGFLEPDLPIVKNSNIPNISFGSEATISQNKRKFKDNEENRPGPSNMTSNIANIKHGGRRGAAFENSKNNGASKPGPSSNPVVRLDSKATAFEKQKKKSNIGKEPRPTDSMYINVTKLGSNATLAKKTNNDQKNKLANISNLPNKKPGGKATKPVNKRQQKSKNGGKRTNKKKTANDKENKEPRKKLEKESDLCDYPLAKMIRLESIARPYHMTPPLCILIDLHGCNRVKAQCLLTAFQSLEPLLKYTPRVRFVTGTASTREHPAVLRPLVGKFLNQAFPSRQKWESAAFIDLEILGDGPSKSEKKNEKTHKAKGKARVQNNDKSNDMGTSSKNKEPSVFKPQSEKTSTQSAMDTEDDKRDNVKKNLKKFAMLVRRICKSALKL